MRTLLLPILALVVGAPEVRSGENLSPGARVRIIAAQAFEIPDAFEATPEAWKERFGKNDRGVITVTREGEEQTLTLPRPGKALKGRLLSLDEKTITLQLDGETSPSRIPRKAIERVQVGYRSRGNAILRGAGIGGLVGAVGGAIAVASGENLDPQAAAAPFVYGTLGGILGAVVGAAMPVERWQDAKPGAVQLGLAPQRRGMGVSLSVKF